MATAANLTEQAVTAGQKARLRARAISFPQKLSIAFALVIGVPLVGYALAVQGLSQARLTVMDNAALEQRTLIAGQALQARGLSVVYEATTEAAAGAGDTPEGWGRRLRALAGNQGLVAACVLSPAGEGFPVVLGRNLALDAAISASGYAQAAAAGPLWGPMAVGRDLALVAAAPIRRPGGPPGVLVIASQLAGPDIALLLGKDACTAGLTRCPPGAALPKAAKPGDSRAGFVTRIAGLSTSTMGLRGTVVLEPRLTGISPAAIWVGMRRSALPGRGPQFGTVAVCAFACALLLAALLTSLVTAWVSRPLEDLRVRVEDVAQGRKTTLLEATGEDAIGRVSAAFNRMVLSLDGAQKQAVHNERLVVAGKMAAAVAHEVRNALAPIQLRAELLQQGVKDPVARENLAGMREEVERGGALLRSLLEFSSMGSHEFRPVDLGDVVRRAGDLVTPHLRGSRIKLTVEDDIGGALVIGDRAQLLQVLVNLLNNAAEADARHITLSAKRVPEGLRVLIRDDGTGMDDETLDRASEPFFTTKPAGQGTGLGLSICHSAVRDHGGALNIESARHFGTRVTITLPESGASQCPHAS